MTDLRRRKEHAYVVTIELEDRVVYLQASPQAVAWDLYGNRLLYHRAAWRYRIVKGSEPEEIVDWGAVSCEICALAAADGPLSDVAQGELVAVVATDAVTANPGWSGPRVVELIAVDPVEGQFVVYSHREDVELPYVTEVAGFAAGGGRLSQASIPQPIDDSPRWHVPHAVIYGDVVYAIERDLTAWPDAGPATGRIVRRVIGGLGGDVSGLELPPGERYVYPHTVAYNPDQDLVYVFATRLNNPDEWWNNYQTSTMSTLRGETLELLGEQPVDFGFKDYEPGVKIPYYLGTWEAAGAANTGGLCVFDGTDAGIAPRFVASARDPSVFNPTPWAPRYWSTFRFWASTRGTFIEGIGDQLPVPIHRTGTGFLGAWQSSFPEEV